VLGCTALLAGMLLWAYAARRLARAGGRWLRWGGVPVAGLLSLVLVYILAVPFAAAVPPRAELTTGPGDGGLQYQDVRIPVGDGVTLTGWWLPTRNGAAVVLRHGSGSTRSSVLRQAEILARHGYGVLMTDARGQGESTGPRMAWGWFGESDLAAAMGFVEGLPGVDDDRIGVVGHSMGGEEALGALGRDARVRAVVAEGVTGRSARDLGWLVDAYGWRGTVTLGVHRAQTAVADLLSPASVPPSLTSAVAAAAPRQVLLITAGTVPDEGHAAARLRAAAPGSVEVWTVPAAGHTAGLSTAPAEWELRVIGFLDGALR
jgi:pimeloyl-ACP methyl ester carboxylesterase